jgi:UDP-N-acetyl-D-glucosamine dehydrogenase
VAFKPDIRDSRNSPAADLIAGLVERGSEVRFHDPHVQVFRDSAGAERESVDLDPLIDWADVLVIATAHQAIDWDAVFGRGDLIVDTVNRSSREALRPRQVLRLGAGWSIGS